MVLNLSLKRIRPLLEHLQCMRNMTFPPVIHVAGTNGKGSTTAYISYILQECNIKTGRFNSPHLVEVRDSIQIANKPVAESIYLQAVREVEDINTKLGFQCTEFELLTAVAMNCFVLEKVDIAILEVGVGGRDDATNVFDSHSVLVTAITKVGLDHQGLLGNTLKEIASQKVGIFKQKVPAVIDGTNSIDVIDTATEAANLVQCPLIIANKSQLPNALKPKLLGAYQYDNLAVAYQVIKLLQSHHKFNWINNITEQNIAKGISNTIWEGRLQHIALPLRRLQINSNDRVNLLMDGAHNTQAAIQLRNYLESVRIDKGFIFVVAFTKGKEFMSIIQNVINSNDHVIATKFSTPVEGMPWIEPIAPAEIKQGVLSHKHESIKTSDDLKTALVSALKLSQISHQPIVVFGSLYLVADVMRLKDQTS